MAEWIWQSRFGRAHLAEWIDSAEWIWQGRFGGVIWQSGFERSPKAQVLLAIEALFPAQALV
jgi:hypothetical protein